MQTLLYLNNYANSFEYINIVNEKKYPRQHLWGVDYLSNHFSVIFPYKTFKNNSKNRIKRILYCIKYQIYIYRNYHNVDIIYAACNHITEIFSLLKIMRFYHGKIFYINHHNNSIMFISGIDRIITISDDIKNILVKRYPKYKQKIININWGGDTTFYESFVIGRTEEYTFIQNGKSSRDNVLLVKALNIISKSGIIYCIDNSLLSLNNEKIIIKTCDISSIENIRLLSICKIMVIPIIITNKSLCGLTSFIDAICMGMPVIVSDNAFLGIDVEKENIGFFYRAGDIHSLMEKMNILISDTDLYNIFSRNCMLYSYKNNYDKFCNSLLKLISQ